MSDYAGAWIETIMDILAVYFVISLIAYLSNKPIDRADVALAVAAFTLLQINKSKRNISLK